MLKNSERVSINASTFQKHIKNFPLVESDEDPPEHTINNEADIRRAPKYEHKSMKASVEKSPLPAKLTTSLCNKIYAK